MGYYIQVEKGVDVYVEDINPGGDKTILFLHGWPGDHNLFEYQFNVLPKYGYRCIGVDQRGFGQSDRPFTGYDYARLADDVRSVINALGLKEITLAGHSTGGAIAVKYMGRHKGYGVSKLALFAAAAPSLIKRPDFPYGVDKNTIVEIIQQTYDDRPQMLQNFGNIFFYQHITEAFSDWFFSLGLKAAGWATAAVADTWINEVLFQSLNSIKVPTLIMQGIHDMVVPFELGKIQNRSILNSKLIPFQYSGHGLFYDEKDRFNKELMKFVES